MYCNSTLFLPLRFFIYSHVGFLVKQIGHVAFSFGLHMNELTSCSFVSYSAVIRVHMVCMPNPLHTSQSRPPLPYNLCNASLPPDILLSLELSVAALAFYVQVPPLVTFFHSIPRHLT